MGQLEPLDLIDFTGGLNIRRTEFNLGENESPEMLNIEIDPRGGIFTRYGWERYNDADIVADPATWDPRIATIAVDQSGAFNVYIANGTTVYKTDQAGDSVDIGAEAGETAFSVGGSIHLADFAEWGDVVYIAAGLANPSVKRDDTAAAGSKNTVLGRTYNDDYTTPTNGNMPQAEHVEPHGSYLFVASVDEVLDINGTGSGVQRSRLRWSHPSKQEDWATNDYIDIEIGGGTITGLMSFRDHLLIFKTDSIWRLYGYGSESFQLDKVSRSVGVPTPSAATRSETAVYFYSASQRGGIYAYDGGSPIELSEQIIEVLETVTNTQYPNVWLGWVGRRLWCSLPYDESGSTDIQSVFIFDPEVGNGSWVRHSTPDGNLTCIIEGSDVEANYPLAVIDGTSGTSAIVRLDKINDAYDTVLPPDGYAFFLTGLDEVINSQGYVTLDGSTSQSLKTPDAAALDITGDICLVADVALDDWTPTAVQTLVSKWLALGGNRSYKLGVATDGTLLFSWSELGSDTLTHSSTVAVPFADGERGSVAVTFDSLDVSGDITSKFWTKADGVESWTQLGASVLSFGSSGIFGSNTGLVFGGSNVFAEGDSTEPMAGGIYGAQVWDGIGANTAPGLGTLVFNMTGVDFADAATFVASSGQTVTVNGSPVVSVYNAELVEHRLVESSPLEANPADDTYLIESENYLPGAGFDTLYRTRWLHAGWPERRKSWRRPRFAVSQQDQSVEINVATNWDYRDNDPRRQHVLGVDPQGSTFWRPQGYNDPEPGGFDWTEDGVSPPGALWGESGASGSELERAPRSGGSGLGGLGVARSVQLEFTTSPLTPARKWGINAMFLKYKTRRYTT